MRAQESLTEANTTRQRKLVFAHSQDDGTRRGSLPSVSTRIAKQPGSDSQSARGPKPPDEFRGS
eukprot:2638794-Rhodomonas_salina.2